MSYLLILQAVYQLGTNIEIYEPMSAIIIQTTISPMEKSGLKILSQSQVHILPVVYIVFFLLFFINFSYNIFWLYFILYFSQIFSTHPIFCSLSLKNSQTKNQKQVRQKKKMPQQNKSLTEKPHRVYFVLVNDSRAWGLSLSMADIPTNPLWTIISYALHSEGNEYSVTPLNPWLPHLCIQTSTEWKKNFIYIWTHTSISASNNAVQLMFT